MYLDGFKIFRAKDNNKIIRASSLLWIILGLLLPTQSCAHIDFGGEGLTYYDPKPYLFVSTAQSVLPQLPCW